MAIRSKKASSKYSNANMINPITASYEVNCTGFLNHVIVAQHPEAMTEIKEYIKLTNDYKGYSNGLPRCLQYYRFLESKVSKKFWEPITDAKQLIPGDLIVYCHNTEKITKGGQHIMMVSDTLQISKEKEWLICPIYDSSGGHGPYDYRGSGIGEKTKGVRS